jgi:hypothetical protein
MPAFITGATLLPSYSVIATLLFLLDSVIVVVSVRVSIRVRSLVPDQRNAMRVIAESSTS